MVAIIEKNMQHLVDLARQFRVERLELFGSATGASFDPERSDIDLLVKFEECSPSEHATRYFGLLAALQDLFGRNVDLIEIQAVRNPYFKKDIESTRVPIYAA